MLARAYLALARLSLRAYARANTAGLVPFSRRQRGGKGEGRRCNRGYQRLRKYRGEPR